MEGKFIEYLKGFYEDKHQLAVITRIARIHDDYKGLSEQTNKNVVDCYVGVGREQLNPIYLKAFYYDAEQLIRCLKELFTQFGRKLDESTKYLSRNDPNRYRQFNINFTTDDNGNSDYKNFIIIYGVRVPTAKIYSIAIGEFAGENLDDGYVNTVATNIKQLSNARNRIAHKTYNKGYEDRMMDLIELGYKAYNVFISHRNLVKKLVEVYENSKSNQSESKLKRVNSF